MLCYHYYRSSILSHWILFFFFFIIYVSLILILYLNSNRAMPQRYSPPPGVTEGALAVWRWVNQNHSNPLYRYNSDMPPRAGPVPRMIYEIVETPVLSGHRLYLPEDSDFTIVFKLKCSDQVKRRYRLEQRVYAQKLAATHFDDLLCMDSQHIARIIASYAPSRPIGTLRLCSSDQVFFESPIWSCPFLDIPPEALPNMLNNTTPVCALVLTTDHAEEFVLTTKKVFIDSGLRKQVRSDFFQKDQFLRMHYGGEAMDVVDMILHFPDLPIILQ